MTKKNKNIEELFNQAKQTEEVFSNNEIRSILEKKYSFADRLSQNLISSTITGAKSMYIYSGIAMISLLAGFLSLSNLFVADIGSQNTQANTKQANVITLTENNTNSQNDNPTNEENKTEKQTEKVVNFTAMPAKNILIDDEVIDIKGVNLIRLNDEELNQIGVDKVSDDTYEISTNNEPEKGIKIVLDKSNIVMKVYGNAKYTEILPRLITDKNGNKKLSNFSFTNSNGVTKSNTFLSLRTDNDSLTSIINISTSWDGNSDTNNASSMSFSTDGISNFATSMVTDSSINVGATFFAMPQLNKEDSIFAVVNEVYLDSIQEKFDKVNSKLITLMPQDDKKAKVMVWNEDAYKWEEQKEIDVDIDTNLLYFNEEMRNLEEGIREKNEKIQYFIKLKNDKALKLTNIDELNEIEILDKDNLNSYFNLTDMDSIYSNMNFGFNKMYFNMDSIYSNMNFGSNQMYFNMDSVYSDLDILYKDLDSVYSNLDILYKDLDSIQCRVIIIENDLTSYIRVNKLVPIALKFPNSSEDVDYILWYDPDTELLNNLPEKYRETIEKEVVASNKEEFCDTKPVAGEETYFDIWRSCAGSIKDMSIFPNPAKEKVSITYTLTEARKISIAIHDLFGRKIAELNPTEMREKGTHTEQFVLQGIESGMYLISIFTDKNETAAQRMIIEK